MKPLKYLLPVFIFCVLGTSGLQAQGFVTTWRTTTADESITIPTTGVGYDYTVDWGDGTANTTHTDASTDAMHTYATVGTYTVTITGTFPRIFVNFAGDREKLLTVEAWGNISWTNMHRAFHGCSNLTIPATDAPDLTGVSDMSYMFSKASAFNQDISTWNVSSVTTMRAMFTEASSFNQDIGTWNVSNVTNMQDMFNQATSFNQNLSSWNVSKVTTMWNMFNQATSFNGDISTWDVSNVKTMRTMFNQATSFNQDIGTWNVSNVTTMREMFNTASAFDQNIGTWNVSQVNMMSGMLNSSGLSSANYDNLLTGWAALPSLQSLITFGAAGINYCTGTAGRDILTSPPNSWLIIDAGRSCSVKTDITAFSFTEQTGVAVIDGTAHTVAVEVLLRTNLTSLIPAIAVSSGAAIDPASGTAQDFSNDFVYTVTAQDGSTTQGWTIVTTTEVNVPPADIALANSSIDENNAAGAVIGVLSATDANTSDTHTYSLVTGTGNTDNDSFSISGSDLVADEVFDYETKTSYSVRIAAEDGSGETVEKAFALTVNNLVNASQTITFGALAAVTSGGADFNLAATASSMLPVSYTSSDPSVASVAGSTVTIAGAGTTDITASQAGDVDYAAATDVVQTLEVTMVTGLEEEAPDKIILHPIPANNTIYIDMGDQKLLEMTVTDLNGKQLTVHPKDSQLDISSLKEGYYILRITTDQGVFSQKIIKQ